MRVFKEVCQTVVEDDGIFFDPDTVVASPIRPQEKYGGIRITLTGSLDRAIIPMQIDIGFADAVSPSPTLTTFPALLSFENPVMMGYQQETAIAEKFQAMIDLGVANSRMKDFLDIAILARTFPFEADTLWHAIMATFIRRQTVLPTALPIALTPDFASRSRQSQWSSFVKKNNLGYEWKSFGLVDAIEQIRGFLWPLRQQAEGGIPLGSWAPGGPWVLHPLPRKQRRPLMRLYALPPIDLWGGWSREKDIVFRDDEEDGDADELSVHRGSYEDFKHTACLLASRLGWEGDTRNGFYVSGLPELDYGGTLILLGWKQDNNGTTFIASPYPLPHLDADDSARFIDSD